MLPCSGTRFVGGFATTAAAEDEDEEDVSVGMPPAALRDQTRRVLW